jgi:hypothetical protein
MEAQSSKLKAQSSKLKAQRKVAIGTLKRQACFSLQLVFFVFPFNFDL